MFSPKKAFYAWIVVLIIFYNPILAQEKISIGETQKIPSTTLHEDRSIQIYLPPSYSNQKIQKTTYPVIYLLDGESNFHYVTGLVEKLSQGPYAYIPEMIVVGIVNTNRSRDLTPTVIIDKQTQQLDAKNSGGNEAFITFIQKELFPWVDSHYRTENYKTLIGHSFGGITALNILLNHTPMFNAYIVHDPSIWYDNQVLLKRFEAATKTDLQNRKLYLTQAGEAFNNSERSDHFNSNKKFKELLEQGKFKNLKWRFQQYENEDHGSIPMIGNLDGLRYIFKGHQINIKAIAEQPDLVANSYRKLSEELHFQFLPTETYIEKVARYFIRQDKMEQAFSYLQQNISRFPNSPQANYSLYEYYLQTNQKEKAQTYLSNALALGYPTN